jgi:hypothetical protein
VIRTLAAICVAGVIAGGAAEGRAVDRDPRAVLQVLFIGNSYTRFNDLPRMVEQLSRSVPSGPALDTSRETRGGYDLRGHWRRRSVRQRIESGRFDAVVIQGHSLAPIRDPMQFVEYVRRFSNHVSASGARPILFQTWARHPQSRVFERYALTDAREMTARVDALYAEIARSLHVPVAPVGRAWEHASEALPDVRLHRSDGTHPAVAGTYLAACVIYGTIAGRDPRAATWRPWRMSRRQAARIRAVAAESLAR